MVGCDRDVGVWEHISFFEVVGSCHEFSHREVAGGASGALFEVDAVYLEVGWGVVGEGDAAGLFGGGEEGWESGGGYGV